MTIMLRLGADAIIVAPEELRDDFLDYLKATLDCYNSSRQAREIH